MKTVYLSLGSNIAPKLSHLKEALAEIKQLPRTRLKAVSSIYVTDPVECVADTEPFLNLCACIETELEPLLLLEYTCNIEAKLLRTRPYRNAPRTIDIDLLIYEGVSMDTKILTLPHPRMEKRAFVLIPLMEVADEKLKKTMKLKLGKLKGQQLYLSDEQL